VEIEERGAHQEDLGAGVFERELLRVVDGLDVDVEGVAGVVFEDVDFFFVEVVVLLLVGEDVGVDVLGELVEEVLERLDVLDEVLEDLDGDVDVERGADLDEPDLLGLAAVLGALLDGEAGFLHDGLELLQEDVVVVGLDLQA